MENENLVWIIFAGAFFIINLFAFLVMFFDKKRSREKGRRISEGDLFFLAICFGALGVFLGMKFAHHKTRKAKFFIGIPLAFLQNITCIFLIVAKVIEL